MATLQPCRSGVIFSHRFRISGVHFLLTATEDGLYSFDFGKRRFKPCREKAVPQGIRKLLRCSESRLRSYFAGKRIDFSTLSVDWSGYSRFERAALCELRQIPWGRKATYQFLARQIGRPRASRAVGSVLHANRLPVIVPCHRILPKRGGIGGFALGKRWKKRLLKLECIGVDTQVRELDSV